MKIGCVKEIKTSEMRVGLTPQSVKAYINQGHTVYVEAGLGLGSDFIDTEYEKAGAIVLSTAKEVWDIVDMMVKVKEPLESEYQYFREDLILYTYLHLAADEKLTKALLDSKTTAIAYETIELDNRELPCLKPMSEVAGRLSAVEGSKFLQKPMGGRGILISGVPGTKRANVVIIGAGVVGV
ncbi:MAG TPA: alanine dehydrogenase, partial [Acholeplasma sp.]|nr:alanine dehydrogenase [Acholeplasma sp.]